MMIQIYKKFLLGVMFWEWVRRHPLDTEDGFLAPKFCGRIEDAF